MGERRIYYSKNQIKVINEKDEWYSESELRKITYSIQLE
jgi:hypothetical protein